MYEIVKNKVIIIWISLLTLVMIQAQLTKALSQSCCVEVYQPWSKQSLVEVAAQCLKSRIQLGESQWWNPPDGPPVYPVLHSFNLIHSCLFPVCISCEWGVRGRSRRGRGTNPSVCMQLCLSAPTRAAVWSANLHRVHHPLLLFLQPCAQVEAERCQQVVPSTHTALFEHFHCDYVLL